MLQFANFLDIILPHMYKHLTCRNTSASSDIISSHNIIQIDLPDGSTAALPLDASFFFGVRIMLGTILGRFSIIYFRGLGLRIKVMVWVMVRARVRVWVGVGVGVRVSVVLWSW